MQSKFKYLAGIMLSGAITSSPLMADQMLSLDQIDFKYQIDPQKGSKPNWYPYSAFSGQGRTFIEFPTAMNSSNLPEIYVKPLNNDLGVPTWHMYKNYLIIDQPAKAVRLVKDGYSVEITKVQNVKQYIAPPPKIIGKYFAGPILSFSAGVGSLDSSSYSSFSTRLDFDYNWALSRHWLWGMGLGGYLLPSTGSNSGNYKNLSAYGADLHLQLTYLFFNGFYITPKGGAGWTKTERTEKSNDKKESKSGIQPMLGLSFGYITSYNISFELTGNYYFSGGAQFSNSSILFGVGYHF